MSEQNSKAALAAQNVSTSQGETMEAQSGSQAAQVNEGATTMVAMENNSNNNFNSKKMNSLSLPQLKSIVAVVEPVATPVVPVISYDCQAALDKFEALEFNAIKFQVSFKTRRGERIAIVRYTLPNGSRDVIELKVNQPILEYLYKVCHAEFPTKPELTGEEDYKAEEGEDFGFEVFRMEAEAGNRFNFKEDYINQLTGEHYLQAINYHMRGAIHYCIKRTPEVQKFLEDKGFILKRSI